MNVCQGMKPNEMVIAFLESILAAGDNAKSPWNFQGFHLSELIVSMDGIPALGNPVRVHFDPAGNSNMVDAYHWLSKSSSEWLSDGGNQTTPDHFAKDMPSTHSI